MKARRVMSDEENADAANVGDHNWKNKLPKHFTRVLTRLQVLYSHRANNRATRLGEPQKTRNPRIVDSRFPVNGNRGNPQNRTPAFVFTQLVELLKEPEEQ